MSRRAAIITQADVARAIRAAKQAGAATVELHPDGRIIVRIDVPPLAPHLTSNFEIEPDHGIVL
jgi:pyridoxine 5'-phosphate synthase PdxJ